MGRSRTRRLIVLHVGVVVVVATCARLGFWQLDRLEQRRALNAVVRSREAQPAQPVERLVPDGPAVNPSDVTYRTAAARGEYDPAREVLLFGRSLGGEPGSHVLTPLVLPDGRALVVDRGWVPIEIDRAPVEEAAPPSGEVRIEGTLLPPETDDAARAAPLERVSLRSLAARLPYPLLPVYLELREQEPPQPSLPRPAPPPQLTEGPHRSYAVQWFLFAAVAVGVYAALVRRELRERDRG